MVLMVPQHRLQQYEEETIMEEVMKRFLLSRNYVVDLCHVKGLTCFVKDFLLQFIV